MTCDLKKNAGAWHAPAGVCGVQSMARRPSSPGTGQVHSVIDGGARRCGVGGLTSPPTSWMRLEGPWGARRSFAVTQRYVPPLPASPRSSYLTGYVQSCLLGRLWWIGKMVTDFSGGPSIGYRPTPYTSIVSRAVALTKLRVTRSALQSSHCAACDGLVLCAGIVTLLSVVAMELGEGRGEGLGGHVLKIWCVRFSVLLFK